MDVKSVPSTAPVTLAVMTDKREISLAGLRIQSPGSVKASPPATMLPALMSVCVQLISWRVEPFAFLNTVIESTVTNTVGHGSAPALSATYIDDVVMSRRPIVPMRMLLGVSEVSFSFIGRYSDRKDESVTVICGKKRN